MLLKNKYLLDHNRLKNRLVMAPISLNFSQLGYVSEEEAAIIIDRAKECGLLVVGSHAVSEDVSSIEDGWVLNQNVNTKGLKQIITKCHANDVKVVIQLYDGDYNHEQYGINNNRYLKEVSCVNSLTDEQIVQKIDQFVKVAEQAINMSFDGVELHAANSFIIQQFLSPYHNQRNDQWGGNQTHREYFLKEILRQINELKQAYHRSDFMVGVRLIPEELPGGIQLEDTLHLIKGLNEDEISYLHLSLRLWNQINMSGQMILQQINDILPSDIKLITSGQIISGEVAEQALEYCDLVSVGMGLLNKKFWGQDNLDVEAPLAQFLGWDYPKLDSSIFLGKHSKVMGPLSTLSSQGNGNFSVSEQNFYFKRANYVDCMIIGAVAISKEGATAPKGTELYEQHHVLPFQKFTQRIQQEGCSAIVQLYHGGQFALINDNLRADFQLFVKGGCVSEELSDWLTKIYFDFTQSMLLAAQAGFRGIELNLTQPYLLGDILSSTNYQQSKKIIKGLVSVLSTIKEKEIHSNFVIGARFNPSEYSDTIEKRLFLQDVIQEIAPLIDYLSSTVSDYRTIESLAMTELMNRACHYQLPHLLAGGIRNEQDKLIISHMGMIPMQARAYIFDFNGNFLTKNEKYMIANSSIQMRQLCIPDGLQVAIKESKEWFSE